jgi:hypothetical protein
LSASSSRAANARRSLPQRTRVPPRRLCRDWRRDHRDFAAQSQLLTAWARSPSACASCATGRFLRDGMAPSTRGLSPVEPLGDSLTLPGAEPKRFWPRFFVVAAS